MRRFLLSVLSAAVMFSLTACNMQQGTPSVNTTAQPTETKASFEDTSKCLRHR